MNVHDNMKKLFPKMSMLTKKASMVRFLRGSNYKNREIIILVP